jgi:hypothetical protein
MIAYLKVGAAIAVVLALVFTVRWASKTIEKANERDQVVAELAEERAQTRANLQAIAQDIADDASGRVAFAGRLDAIDRAISDIVIPPAKNLIQPIKEVPGAPCSNSFGVSDSFVGVYNEAAARAGAPPDQTH